MPPDAQPHQRRGGQQPDARRQPCPVELPDIGQPVRLGRALHGLDVNGGPGQQADQDHPVEPRRGIQREEADGHDVIPRPLVGGDEQPGQAQRQGWGHRGQAGCPVREAGHGQHRDAGEQQVGDQFQMRRNTGHAELRVPEHWPPEQLVHRVPGNPGTSRDEDLDRGHARRPVARQHRRREPGRRGHQRPDRSAARPGYRQAEQPVLGLDAGRDTDHQAGQGRVRGADPPAPGPQRDDAQQPGERGEPVDVAAGHDLVQQQRVDRPEQVSAKPLGWVGAEHPVQDQDHRAEGQRRLQLQPERDAGQR